MSTEKHNIFNSSKALSEQEIKSYLSGKLSPEEMQAIEQKMQNSGFEMEAMEGFEENPNAINAVSDLKAKFHATNIQKPFWNTKTYLVAASITGILIISSILFFDNPQQNNNLVSEVIKTEEEKTSEEKLEKSAEIIEIEEAEVIHDSNQIKSEEVIENTPITLHLSEDEPVEEEEIAEAFVESFQLKKVSAKAVTINVKEEDVVKSNTKTRYLNDFLIVDYSDIYSGSSAEMEDDFELSGTPAKYKTLNDTAYELNEVIIETEEIDYIDFLSITLSKYKDNKYKKALKNFKLIIDQYPNDVNAHFYGGLCYYNIDNPTKAIEFFDFILNQNINTFHQEAQYYKAMCLIRLGKADQAKFIFQKIANQDGFFAEKAKEMLEKSR